MTTRKTAPCTICGRGRVHIDRTGYMAIGTRYADGHFDYVLPRYLACGHIVGEHCSTGSRRTQVGLAQ